MARRTTCVYEQIDGHECPDAPFRQSWCRPCLEGEVEHLRAILRRMSSLVIDFGGDECFCPADARDTGRYCEVCELRGLAQRWL